MCVRASSSFLFLLLLCGEGEREKNGKPQKPNHHTLSVFQVLVWFDLRESVIPQAEEREFRIFVSLPRISFLMR